MYHVDGYDKDGPTVYKFHSCLWHSCPKCYHDRHKHTKLHPYRTFQEMYEATITKGDALFTQGYNVIIKCECEWDREVKTDDNLKAFLADLRIVNPLEPRDAFFGGHTNATTL